MFTDCERALHVDSSTWPAIPLFQPPPQPVLPPPPVEGTSTQLDSDVAMDADNLEADL